MSRRTPHFAVLLAAGLLVFASHGSFPQAATLQSRAGIVNSITVPDVAGAPFSATVVVEYQHEWDDGSVLTRRTVNLIARDSHGRTHNETRRLMPEYFHGSPELLSVRLFDPLIRTLTLYEPASHIARQQLIPKKPETTAVPNPTLRTEDLGVATLNGLQARGTRRTVTLPRKTSGTGSPVDIVGEEWYSEVLHMNLLVRYSDPRVGVQTLALSGLKREEPPAAMFQVPQGYKTLEFAPPAAPAPVSGPPPTGLQGIPNP